MNHKAIRRWRTIINVTIASLFPTLNIMLLKRLRKEPTCKATLRKVGQKCILSPSHMTYSDGNSS